MPGERNDAFSGRDSDLAVPGRLAEAPEFQGGSDVPPVRSTVPPYPNSAAKDGKRDIGLTEIGVGEVGVSQVGSG